jgi:hypothetical protein
MRKLERDASIREMTGDVRVLDAELANASACAACSAMLVGPCEHPLWP